MGAFVLVSALALGAAFLGAAFLGAAFALVAVFVLLLDDVDFFTAIGMSSLLNMFARLRPTLIERSLRQFIPNL